MAREIESEADRRTILDRTESERNTLGDMIMRDLQEVTPTKKGAAPADSRLRAFLRRPIAQYKMSALSSAMFAQYRDERLETVTAGTVNKELNHVSHLIETARREWRIGLPCTRVSGVKLPNSQLIDCATQDGAVARNPICSDERWDVIGVRPDHVATGGPRWD